MNSQTKQQKANSSINQSSKSLSELSKRTGSENAYRIEIHKTTQTNSARSDSSGYQQPDQVSYQLYTDKPKELLEADNLVQSLNSTLGTSLTRFVGDGYQIICTPITVPSGISSVTTERNNHVSYTIVKEDTPDLMDLLEEFIATMNNSL